MGVARTFSNLIAAWPRVPIAIDIPIGLPAAGSRDADRLARARLGRRRSSVFPAPLRAGIEARTHSEASAIRRSIDGKGVSAQAWGIFGKVREVDACMTPELQRWVLEVHPELSFTTMAAGVPPPHGKKTEEGKIERLTLLQRHLQGAPVAIDKPRPPGSASDDLLDALSVLWTAERYDRNEAQRVPEQPVLDDCGLRMEIWY